MDGYELLYVLRPDLEEDKLEALKEKVKKALTGKGAKIIDEENLGQRELATPIDKITKGHYERLEFEASGEAIKEMKKVLGINDAVLREMCVKLKSIRNKPKQEELAK
ncbi:30S ribosomal protein S6 [Candidatus Margulisiibacteriota bacterium]